MDRDTLTLFGIDVLIHKIGSDAFAEIEMQSLESLLFMLRDFLNLCRKVHLRCSIILECTRENDCVLK